MGGGEEREAKCFPPWIRLTGINKKVDASAFCLRNKVAPSMGGERLPGFGDDAAGNKGGGKAENPTVWTVGREESRAVQMATIVILDSPRIPIAQGPK